MVRQERSEVMPRRSSAHMMEASPHKRGWLRVGPAAMQLRGIDYSAHRHAHPEEHEMEKGPAPPLRIRAIRPAVVAAVLCAAAALVLVPNARHALTLLDAQDDPVALSDMFLAKALTPSVVRIEIENALSADDAELAASFLELARDRGVYVDPALVQQVEEANSASAQALRAGKSYYKGLTTGAPEDLAGFAGAMTRDLSGYGDIQDAVAEGTHLAKGEPADELVFGLACAGLAATAATFVTVGAAAPLRAGLSIVKAARRTGRLAGPLALWTRRTVREAFDTGKLSTALSKVTITAPAESVTIVRDAVKEAVRLERLEGLTTVMLDVGRIQARGGTRAALEGLRLSETPAEVARVARLAERQGTKTGAILKLAGRAAIVLSALALHLAGWVFSAVWAVIGFLIAIKSITERTTERYLRWRKRRRARRLAAEQAADEAAHQAAEPAPAVGPPAPAAAAPGATPAEAAKAADEAAPVAV
jgi:hypothetical protein